MDEEARRERKTDRYCWAGFILGLVTVISFFVGSVVMLRLVHNAIRLGGGEVTLEHLSTNLRVFLAVFGCGIPAVTSILAIIFSSLGLRRFRLRDNLSRAGLGVAGLAMGVVLLVLALYASVRLATI